MNFRSLIVACLLFASLAAYPQRNRSSITAYPQTFDSVKVTYKNKFLVFPIVALSTETSWVFGVANAYIFKTSKKDSTLRTSTMPSGFLYTLNDQILIALGANIFLPKEKYIIRFESSFSKFPDKFWGIGNETPDSAKENYTFTQFYINPAISRRIARNFYLGLGIEFQSVFNIKYEAGGNFEDDQVIGIYNRDQYNVFGWSALFTWDSRNHAYTPNRGGLFRVKYSNFNENRWSDYNFETVDFDFRRFVKLKPQKTLAFQAYSLLTFGDVPYRNLAILGGNSMMRGYYGGRYRDKMYFTAQAEYRFPVYWRFGGVAFASAGQVAPELNQFSFSKFHYAAGGGIRFSVLPKENLNLRFDIAYGNQVNYYIVLAESF